jgi:hypothetical protein
MFVDPSSQNVSTQNLDMNPLRPCFAYGRTVMHNRLFFLLIGRQEPRRLQIAGFKGYSVSAAIADLFAPWLDRFTL